jgi:hypothetical protein
MKYLESNRDRNRKELNEIIKQQTKELLYNSIYIAPSDLIAGRECLNMSRLLYKFLDKDLVFENTFEDVVRQYGIIFNSKRGID